MGKIADAFVEIGGRDSAFRESVQRLEAIMHPLGKNAESFARAMESASDKTGGVFSGVLSGAATALRVYSTVTLATKAYSLAARASSVINPFAGIKANAMSIISSAFSALNTKFGKAAIALLAVAAAAAVAVAAFKSVSAGVQRASDLAEQVDFSKIVMGDGFDKASKAADELSNKFGVLRKDTLNVATTSASLAKNLGFTREEATGLGVDVALLASDLSSAANTSFAQAAGAIQALFRGESDPIERFGVTINEAAVDAEALKSGLARTKEEIDQTVKFQARWNLLIKQTADSQGNLNKTSSSFANVMRNVKGQGAEALTTLGEAFMPIAGSFARLALVGTTALRRLAEGFNTLMTPVKFMADQLNSAYDSLAGMAGIDPKKFKLFEADPAKQEAKKLQRFQDELAAEQKKKAEDLADFELKKKHGLLTDADKGKADQAAMEAYQKFNRETEAAAKKMLDLQDQEAKLIEKKTEKQRDFDKEMQRSHDDEKQRLAELFAEHEKDSRRKAEDLAIDEKRRQEDRLASFNFKGLAEARDMMFTAAIDQGREQKRAREDAALAGFRKREDVAQAANDIETQGQKRRLELQQEKQLTDAGLAKEIDRVVAALSGLKVRWNMVD